MLAGIDISGSVDGNSVREISCICKYYDEIYELNYIALFSCEIHIYFPPFLSLYIHSRNCM